MNLIPDVEYPTLTVQSIDGGGLLAGSYQFAVAYKLKTGDYTDYSLLSPTYFAAPKYNESIKSIIEDNLKKLKENKHINIDILN